jgi:hypothetical protein
VIALQQLAQLTNRLMMNNASLRQVLLHPTKKAVLIAHGSRCCPVWSGLFAGRQLNPLSIKTCSAKRCPDVSRRLRGQRWFRHQARLPSCLRNSVSRPSRWQTTRVDPSPPGMFLGACLCSASFARHEILLRVLSPNRRCRNGVCSPHSNLP